MKKSYITYMLFAISLLVASCSSEEKTIVQPPMPDYTWEEEEMSGPSATISPFLPGDDLTRSSLVYGSQKMVFGWEAGDKIGIYPTAKKLAKGESGDGLLNPNEDGHPEYKHPNYNAETNNILRTNPILSQQRRFGASMSSSQTAQLFNNDQDFEWDNVVQWTAYFPYKQTSESYDERAFSFEGQIQEGIVDISANRKGTTGYAAGDNNPVYKASEVMASKHLGGVDYLISPEMAWSGERINFQLRHVGAIIRVYLKAPEKNLVITKLQLICNKKIFYEKGKVTLRSHPYKDGAGVADYGVDLDKNSGGCQIKPVPVGEPTNNLTLNFYDDNTHQQALSIYDASDQYKRYVTGYIMTYPITYNPATDGDLFAYVTAYVQGDPGKKEVHFVSNPLVGFDMKSGHYYQLSSATTEQDGLYPIELTATLLPWQDIVGAGINTDLEK